MQEIAAAIKEGAIAYLNRQMKSMGITGAVIFIIIFVRHGRQNRHWFLIGRIASFLAGYIGMRVSVIANVRTAEAAKRAWRRFEHGFQRRFGYRYDGGRPGTDRLPVSRLSGRRFEPMTSSPWWPLALAAA
jgi:hypothetical protein